MYSKDSIDRVIQNTSLEAIAGQDLELQKAGKSLKGDCPFCNAKQNFYVIPQKQIFKCHQCQVGGKGAVKYLMKTKDITFLESLEICSSHCNIPLEKVGDSTQHNHQKITSDKTFRDNQLQGSGITNNSQISELADGKPINRYESGSVDKFWNRVEGDDMILNYVDLNRRLETYTHPKTGDEIPFTRIRHQNPDDHIGNNGEPMKYRQRAKSGSHLWLPEVMIKGFKAEDEIKTLFITEGEKKADKMCQEGMMAIGLMGINNLSGDSKMKKTFLELLKKCKIENVVFFLDSDWNDISKKSKKPIETRPQLFFYAVKKFRDYFLDFQKEGILLEVFFSYVLPNKVNAKGVDDLLVSKLEEKESEYFQDFEKINEEDNCFGEYFNCHKISNLSDSRLMNFWHLNNKKDLAKFNQEELSSREYFFIGSLRYKFDGTGELICLDELKEDEKFWRVDTKILKDGEIKKTYHFQYQGMRVFLRKRGFGRILLPNNDFRYVRVIGKVVKEVTTSMINDFVFKYVEENCEKAILEMLLRGGSQYLGQEKLSKMYLLNLEFVKSEKNRQYLFFENSYWEINKDKIISKNYDDLNGFIWENQVIDFSPKLTLPLVKINREFHNFCGTPSPDFENCHIAQFLHRTSFHSWKDYFELKQNEKGERNWVEKLNTNVSLEERKKTFNHMVSKMIAIGYLLHNYLDPSETKAIICMDGAETEVGSSNGGNGKSLFGQIINQLIPTVIIDGKKQRLTEDQFIYEEVDERTQNIFVDDCRANLDFEYFFSQISRGITINGKGVKRYSRPAPKFLFTTNHAINGDGNSFRRRQFFISFCDWYNEFRTPKEDFGCVLFNEWDSTQWNLFYNFIGECIQTYFKYKLQYEIPLDDLGRRKLRQRMSEDFLEWATLFYSSDHMLNKKVEKNIAYNKFLEDHPQRRKYSSMRKFKKKVKLFCQYNDLAFNPIASIPGGDIKSNGKEFFIIANDNFNPQDYDTISD